MTHQDFEKYLADRLRRTLATLASKSVEYSSGGDRMHNFVVACGISTNPSATPEKMAWEFACKHFVSVRDLLMEKDSAAISADAIREKFGDAINYLILAEAMMLEKVEH